MTRQIEPIFILFYENESLMLKSFQTSGNSSKIQYLTHSLSFLQQQLDQEILHQSSFDFYLSCMIVLTGDSYQRTAIKRKTARAVRNIELKTARIHDYLKEAMQKTSKKTIKGKPITVKMLNSILDKAFVDVKVKLGFPDIDPVEYSYEITDEVIVAATTDKCKDYLKQSQTIPILLDNDFKRIASHLQEDYADEANQVITALKKTKSRNHIGAISITPEQDEIFVHVVNPYGQQIKMESWKFLLIIEKAKDPIVLYDFYQLDRRDPKPSFIFNNQKKGIVEGRFNPDRSSIEVLSHDRDSKEVTDKATFMIDSTYTLCLYSTLKRLKEDKVRFTLLQEQAQTIIGNKDYFDEQFK